MKNILKEIKQALEFLIFISLLKIVSVFTFNQTSKIGSFLVGVIGQFATGYYPTFAGIITFAMLILILAFRPQGILGKKQ